MESLKLIPQDRQTLDFAEQERIKGKNLFIYPYYTNYKHQEGIEFKNNGNGSFTVNGKQSSTNSHSVRYLYLRSGKPFKLSAGTYTLGLFGDIANTGLAIVLYTGEYYYNATINNPTTFTIAEEKTLDVYIQVAKDNVVTFNNLKCYPMLVRGESLGEYQKYQGQISRDGDSNIRFLEKEYQKRKNILPYPYHSDTTKQNNGVVFVDNGDGTININGTIQSESDGNSLFYLTNSDNSEVLLKAGTYTLYHISNQNEENIYVTLYDKTNNQYFPVSSNRQTKIVLENDIVGYFYVEVSKYKKDSVENYVVKPMLLEGDGDYNEEWSSFNGNLQSEPVVIYDRNTKNQLGNLKYSSGIPLKAEVKIPNVWSYKKVVIYSQRGLCMLTTICEIQKSEYKNFSSFSIDIGGTYFIVHDFWINWNAGTLQFRRGGYMYVKSLNDFVEEGSDSENVIYRIEGYK